MLCSKFELIPIKISQVMAILKTMSTLSSCRDDASLLDFAMVSEWEYSLVMTIIIIACNIGYSAQAIEPKNASFTKRRLINSQNWLIRKKEDCWLAYCFGIKGG